MKSLFAILFAMLAGFAQAGTVTLSTGSSCVYTAVAGGADSLTFTCAAVAPQVVPKPPAVVPLSPPGSSLKGYPLNGSLDAPGRWVFHRGPRNARYAIPDVPANTALEVTASGGYEPVRITIYGPDGQVLRGAYGIAASRDFPAGAGEVRGATGIAGHYQAEVEGGGELTTINHRRSPL